MSMHSTAAEDAAYFLRHIPRTPDELAATDVWELKCDDCGLSVQGGTIALAAHRCVVHADLVEADKARRRRESAERARQRSRERYRVLRDQKLKNAPQIPAQPLSPPRLAVPRVAIQEALFDPGRE